MELTDNDRQRIEQLESDNDSLIREIERLKQKIEDTTSSMEDYYQDKTYAEHRIETLEAERSELRNKVIELEQTIRKIQDKAIELYGNQIELP